MSDTPASSVTPPEAYGEWLADLGGRIHGVQQRATLAVNRKLMQPYWQKSQNKIVAEYALGDEIPPMGIAEYKLIESLPVELQNSLSSIEQIERELAGDGTFMEDESQ